MHTVFLRMKRFTTGQQHTQNSRSIFEIKTNLVYPMNELFKIGRGR
jgi:hypothetical protein